MAAFEPDDIAVGGVREYIEIKHANGSHAQTIHVTDLGATSGGPQTYVTGLAFQPKTGELFAVSTPSLTVANAPHAICNFPNYSGLLIAYVPSPGVLKFRKVSYANPPVQIGTEWTPGVEAGWPWTGTNPANNLVRISIACDNRTVFYTFQGKKIKRFDLQTGTTWTDYRTLASDSPYIYGGIQVLPGGSGTSTTDTRKVVVAMTQTGTGPQLAVALAHGGDVDALSHPVNTVWTDEANPTGSHRILHWSTVDNDASGTGDLLGNSVTQADLVPHNDRTLSLAINYNLCPLDRRGQVWVLE
jgi:hypothetical protein